MIEVYNNLADVLVRDRRIKPRRVDIELHPRGENCAVIVRTTEYVAWFFPRSNIYECEVALPPTVDIGKYRRQQLENFREKFPEAEVAAEIIEMVI